MVNSMILQAEGIHKHFGNNEVLKGVSVTARKGDVISMTGSCGFGKKHVFTLPEPAGATQRRPHCP